MMEDKAGARAAPACQGRDSLAKVLRRNLSFARLGALLRRGRAVLRQRGWQALGREIAFRLRLATHREVWRYRADIPLRRELRAQRREAATGALWPLISVVVPLYNTPPRYFKQLLKSVRGQSYPHWQLVLADGGAPGFAANPAARRAKRAAGRDKRVAYVPLGQNKGIAGNTNTGLAAATGAWLALCDHDDVLQKNALYEVAKAARDTGAQLVYSDEIVLNARLKRLCEYHFKGGYGPDTLRGCNTITHLCAFTRALLEKAGGGEDSRYDGAQDYDLILRLTEAAGAGKICHVPKVLYFWRRHAGSTAADIAAKPAAVAAGVAAVQAQLGRLGLEGTASALAGHPGAVGVRYAVKDEPLVSVLIPSSDHTDDLARCLESLYQKAGWSNLETLVLDNNSSDMATAPYYEEAKRRYPRLRVLRYEGAFNYSAINNFGAVYAMGDHFLLLNNDVRLLTDGFVRELLSYSQRPDVGAVGALLYYPDDTVQHAGLIVGLGGTAGGSHKGHARANGGDMYRLATVQNVSAVTGAAMMVKRRLYEQVGGLDEAEFAIGYNDVDFCLRLRRQGLWNVFTPFAEAYHYESKSRGYDTEGARKQRHDSEAAAFRQKWAEVLQAGDPFYNSHFTLKTENFAYK